MVISFWQPKEEEFNKIYALLEQQITHPADRTWTAQQFQREFPDLNNYLAFILARAEGKSPVVRQGAGLLLKNNLKSTFKSMPAANQGYVKSELLHCLEVADRQIKCTVGTTISVLVQLVGISGWPQLLQALVICLDSNEENHMECAMDAFLKICEDIPQVLSSETSGLSEPPINFFLPKLFQLFQSPNALLREQSLKSVNRYIELMPTVLHMSMDQYVQGLFGLANDPDPEVRILVCAAFAQLIEVSPASFAPHLRNVIECILQLNKDPDDVVAMKACEFWCAYYQAQLPLGNLRELLPRLIPVLLVNLVYLEDDESLVNAEDDGSLPDRDQDMRPHFHSSHFHGSEDAEVYDDDDVTSRWTLRKCSIDALEFISTMFEDEILPTLMPIVCAKVSTSDDATWKEREVAVLAFGTIADGCFKGLYPHLSEIVAFVHHLLDDKFPLIRSISCWTLSRFSKFIVKEIRHQEGQERFDNVLTGLLRRMLDNNKRVQASACSAFLILAEATAEELAPRLGIILQHLMCAFENYQRYNLRILYDAIITLANAVGEELNKPEHLGVLLPPLISKSQQLSDSNRDLYPLIQCFKFIAQALGGRFSKFPQPVFQRCINIIQTRQLAKVHSASDDELAVCSLELLSGLVGGLGSGVESLVSQSNLRDLLLQCCMDDDAADVRQSALELLGHLARVCPIHLHPRLAEFIDVAAKQQALGGRFSQFAQPVFERCISILQNRQLAKAKVHFVPPGFKFDDELVVSSLDLLSGLAGGLGSCVESLVSQSNLRDLLLQCCMDDDVADVRRSAFTLLGHLARVCPIHLHPRLAEFFDVAAKQLNATKLKTTSSVANRACWAIGELAIKVHREVRPCVMRVLSYLVPILQQPEKKTNKSLRENSAITIGRLAWVCPELVSPHIRHFMQPWCIALSMLYDSVMKEDAFRGLCAVVRANPSGASSSLVFIFQSIASLHEIRSEDLRNEVSQILCDYKQILMSIGAWEECMSALKAPTKDKLSQYFV